MARSIAGSRRVRTPRRRASPRRKQQRCARGAPRTAATREASAALAHTMAKLRPNGPVRSPICSSSGTSRCAFAIRHGKRFGKKNSSVTQKSARINAAARAGPYAAGQARRARTRASRRATSAK